MLDQLRERTEDFLEAAAQDRCRFELEDQPGAAIGGRYAGAVGIFGQDRIRDVQRALAGAAGTEEKGLRHLLEFLAFGHARCVAAGELDRLFIWESRASLTVGERFVPLRAAREHLRRTSDRALRKEIEEARLSAVDEQQPVIEGLLAHQRNAVEELGYGSFVQSWEVLSGIDLRGLARDAGRFLADTEALHRELLAWYLPRLAGAEPREAGAADAARIEAGGPFLERLPAARVLARLRGALEASGLDLEAGGRLRAATRTALPSGAGAVCCALRVPEEVVLTVSAATGRPAHASLLYQLGFALQRAHTAADLPVELRWLGDGSVPLAFGRTFAGLLANRPFLERVYDVPRAELPDLLRLATAVDLLRLRRAAALLQVELAVFAESEPQEAIPLFVEAMGKATGLRHDPREAMWALRTPFRVARALRAEQLEAVLSSHLRDRFDDDWWRNPRSAALLLDLFQAGQSYTAAELSVQIASRTLGFERVRERLEERL